MALANTNNEQFYLNLIQQGKLKVTKEGRAFNLITGREIGKIKQGCFGYRKLSWMDPTTRTIVHIQLHRLVWAYFNGIPQDNTLVINHIDGNKQNCNLSNLELVTPLANREHAYAHSLMHVQKGGDKVNAKFTDDDVIKLREEFALNNITVKQIMAMHNCSNVIVYNMLKGKSYSHIK